MRRGLGWRGPDLPHGEDYLYSSRKFRGTIPNETDLVMPPTEDQFYVGSCVFKGITEAMEVAQIFGPNIEAYYLSALDLYWAYRKAYGNVLVDDGAQIRMALDLAKKRGICEEHVWPYGEGENWDKQPPKAPIYHKLDSYWRLDGESSNETIDNIIAALASGATTGNNKVVIFGTSLYESFESDYTAKTGNVDMPNFKAEKFIGGHCMVIKGYTRNERMRVRNSWGPWGYNQSGDCFIPFDYMKQLARDFHIIDVVTEK